MREIKPIDRAIANARRDSFRAASGMTNRELRANIDEFRRVTGGEPPAGSEAALMLRMMRAVIRRRLISPRSRSRAAAEFRAART